MTKRTGITQITKPLYLCNPWCENNRDYTDYADSKAGKICGIPVEIFIVFGERSSYCLV
jgi:hypothetical protein